MKLPKSENCSFCGASYLKKRKWQEYCGKVCKMKGHHINKGREYTEERNEILKARGLL